MNRLIFISFLLVATTAFANDFIKDAEPAILEVRYTRTEVYDTINRDSFFFKDEMMLRIGKTKAMFCNIKRFNQDSLLQANPDAYWAMMAAEIDAGNRDAFSTLGGHKKSYLYIDYANNQTTEEDYFDMTPWRYREAIETPTWDIEDEIKTISGFECNKAVTEYRGRRWTAWFATELPLSFGPWKLHGLPGLILEAYDADRNYVFECRGLMQNGIGDVGFCKNRKSDDYIDVSRDKFFNNWWKYKHSNFAVKICIQHLKRDPGSN